MNCAIYFYHAIFCSSVYVLYIVQCGVQLTIWFNSANVMFNSLGCNFPSCQACLVWLTVWSSIRSMLYFSIGVYLTAWFICCGLVHLLWCLVNCLVQFCNAMFNCCGCILLLYTMWGINQIWLHLIHEKHIQVLYFLVLNHAWFG